jgi:hypothetical protein
MPSGGKRKGAGRKSRSPFDPFLIWIVGRVRALASDLEFIQERQLQFIKRRDKNQVQNQIDLHSNYKELKRANLSQRHAMIADDCGTPLEETRQILTTDGFPRYLSLPPPNQFQMNKIYKQVAKEATVRFGKEMTVRTVKDCVGAWRKFEKQFSDGP